MSKWYDKKWRKWVHGNDQLCPMCGEVFASDEAADSHQVLVGGELVCLTPDILAGRKVRPLVQNSRGAWTRARPNRPDRWADEN